MTTPIKYRISSTATKPVSDTVKGAPLTSLEIDGNFRSIKDSIELIQSAYLPAGYSAPVEYVAGVILSSATQTVAYQGEVYAPVAAEVPFTTSGTFEVTKFVQVQSVASVDLAATDGAAKIGYDGGTVQDVLEAVTGPSGAASVGYTPAGAGAVATTAQSKLRETVSVKDFGAIGDGTSNPLSNLFATLAQAQVVYPHATALTDEIDWAAAQAAINYVKTKGWQRRPEVAGSQQGGVVLFASGGYVINRPLTLPRSGLYDGYAVALVGETMTSSVLIGSEAFPANRGMIEWESIASRVYWQTIQDITFLLPRTVSNVKAVHFVPVDGSTTNSLFLEAMHGLLMRRIQVDATNTVNSHAIKFDGYVRHSRFETIRANFALGSNPTLNTVLLQFPENTGTSASIFGESNGVAYSVFDGIYGMGEQGGSGSILRGRLYECTLNQILCGNTTLNNYPSIAIIRSVATRITQLNIEGGTIQIPAEIYLQDSHGVSISEIGAGSPYPGNQSFGLSLVGCYNCRIDGRYTDPASPAFSTSGGKAIKIDSTSIKNTFTRFYLNADISSEVQIDAPSSAGNVIEYYYPSTGQYGVLGLRPGALLATAESNATQTINSGTFTQLIFGNETLDPLSIYNPATGAITCPLSGRYRITYTAYISGIVSGKQIDLQVSINGVASTYIERYPTGTETFRHMNGSVVYNATAGQTLGIGINHNFGSAATLTQYALSATIAFEYLG